MDYRSATSRMPSRTRTAGFFYRRPRCRSWGTAVGGLPSLRPARFERVRDHLSVCSRHRRTVAPRRQARTSLAAWGFTIEGRRVLLHLMAGSKEDTETVTAFFEDMKRRGLNDPLLVTSDGAPGIIKAIDVCFPRTARQRCLAHRMRNLIEHLPGLSSKMGHRPKQNRSRRGAKWDLKALYLIWRGPRMWCRRTRC